jgi:stage IV sporulation protein FB
MFLSEGDRTPLDWNFRLFGTPVRVSPWFWVLCIMGGGSQIRILSWAIAVFISILVHEFGHVFAMRRYGIPADILLYGFGGLAIPRNSKFQTWSERIVISFAGPLAGFIFAAVIALVAKSFGAVFDFRWFMYVLPGLEVTFPQLVIPDRTTLFIDSLFNNLMYVNLAWGFFNLFPIYPLDGGQISLAWLGRSGRQGRQNAYQISMIVAGLVAFGFVLNGTIFFALFMAVLAYQSFQLWQQSAAEPKPYFRR